MSVRDYLDQGNSGGKFCPKCVWYRSTHWGPRLNRKETVSWVHTSITASYCEDCGLLSQAPAAMAFPPRRTVPSNSELKQTLPTIEEEGQKEGKNQRSGSIRSNSVFWIPGDCGPRKVAAAVVACTESRQSTFQHGRRRLKGPPSNTPSWMGMGKVRRRSGEWKWLKCIVCEAGVVVHTFWPQHAGSSSRWVSVRSRSTWSTWWVPHQTRLHNEILPHKKKKKSKKRKEEATPNHCMYVCMKY